MPFQQAKPNVAILSKPKVVSYNLPEFKKPRIEKLWETRAEEKAYEYTELCMIVLTVTPKLTYTNLKQILHKHKFPVDCGQVLRALLKLEKQNLVTIKRNKEYTITLN